MPYKNEESKFKSRNSRFDGQVKTTINNSVSALNFSNLRIDRSSTDITLNDTEQPM